MFYENYLSLCNSIGKTPSAVALEIGIEKSTVTRWKQGKSQTDANLKKVADYFGVTIEYLRSEQKKPASENGDGAVTFTPDQLFKILDDMSVDELLALNATVGDELKKRLQER